MPNRAALWRARAAGGGPGRPVVERCRTGLTVDLGGGRRRMFRSLRAVHLLDGTAEIDTDLQSDSGGFVAKARRTDYGIRFAATGGRRISPRAAVPQEHLTVGRPQRLIAGTSTDLTVASLTRRNHQMFFGTPGGKIVLSVLPSRVATEVVYSEAAQNVPWRWPLTLNNLTWRADQDGALIVGRDGIVVMRLAAPRWWDSGGLAGGREGTVPWSYDGQYLTFSPPDLTGAKFPVTVDPDFSTQIGASADDGYVNVGTPAFNYNGTYLACGQGNVGFIYHTWLCFRNITVPDGSTVSDAHSHLRTTSDSLPGTCLSNIFVIDEDDHTAPQSYSGTNAWTTDHGLHTTASVAWDFTVSDTDDTEQTTPSFHGAFQEWLDRPGYTAGYDLGVHIDDDGSAAGDAQAWASYDNTSYAEPDLDVVYTEPSSSVSSWGMQIF